MTEGLRAEGMVREPGCCRVGDRFNFCGSIEGSAGWDAAGPSSQVDQAGALEVLALQRLLRLLKARLLHPVAVEAVCTEL